VLNEKTLHQLTQVIRATRTHADEYWRLNDEEINNMKPNKIDISIDLNGSFLIDKFQKLSDSYIKLTLDCVNKIDNSANTNFLSLSKIGTLDITKGPNSFDSCL